MIRIGDKVRFASEKLRSIAPEYYPPVGTLGEIIGIDSDDGGLCVQWALGSTSRDDCWWCGKYDVEPVED